MNFWNNGKQRMCLVHSDDITSLQYEVPAPTKNWTSTTTNDEDILLVQATPEMTLHDDNTELAMGKVRLSVHCGIYDHCNEWQGTV